VLQEIDASHVKALRVKAGRVIQRNAREVALHVTGNSIRLILMILADPFPFQAHLSECRSAHKQNQEQTTRTSKAVSGNHGAKHP